MERQSSYDYENAMVADGAGSVYLANLGRRLSSGRLEPHHVLINGRPLKYCTPLKFR